MSHYLRGTVATYKRKDKKYLSCDLVKLAKHYGSNIGNVPERVGDGRAAEISLLAREFLNLYRHYKKCPKVK